MRAFPGLLALSLTLACAQVDSPNAPVVLPADYKATFMQVRDCRPSADHDLHHIVVRVKPELAAAYNAGPYPLPAGSLVVKEEFGDQDAQCQNLLGYTVMRKEAGGYFPAGGDWQYFTLDSLGAVLVGGPQPRCASCHTSCPGGRDRDRLCANP